jgi:hypothetical protein
MKSSSGLREDSFRVNELIRNHSERVEALKQALKGARTVSDELPLLRELTEEIRTLRELRQKRYDSSYIVS